MTRRDRCPACGGLCAGSGAVPALDCATHFCRACPREAAAPPTRPVLGLCWACGKRVALDSDGAMLAHGRGLISAPEGASIRAAYKGPKLRTDGRCFGSNTYPVDHED